MPTYHTSMQFHHNDEPPPHYSAPIPEQNTPLDIFRDFSSTSPQEYLFHEQRLYQLINFHGRVRLGLAKAISVLERERNQSDEYKPLIRPYQIDQPADTPLLSPLIPNSEALLFANTFHALVAVIGLQRSSELLVAAKAEEIPGVLYVIERVTIPTRVSPIAASQRIVAVPQSIPQIGPFARPRSDSGSSTASTVYEPTSTPSRTIHSSRPTMPIVGDRLSSKHLPTEPVIVRPRALPSRPSRSLHNNQPSHPRRSLHNNQPSHPSRSLHNNQPSHPTQYLHNMQNTMTTVHDLPHPLQFSASTSNVGSTTNNEYDALLSQFQNMVTPLIDHMNSILRALPIQ
jgi:hypothetical protein